MLHASPTSKSRFALRDTFAGYAFLFPFLAIYAVFNLYPMIQGFIISFFKWNITDTKTFIAFDNYIRLFQDPVF